EGRDKVVSRLKEIHLIEDSNDSSHGRGTRLLIVCVALENLLKNLTTANDASLNSHTKRHELSCLHNTRDDLL
ncbi:MAG: hypothetical protein FE78DRAFT_107436, partial [Acidomyces sp. 'richmondensis']